jgi:hypothetical protein
MNKCDDISIADVSRLAWIETEELMEKLREVLVTRTRKGIWVGSQHSIAERGVAKVTYEIIF